MSASGTKRTDLGALCSPACLVVSLTVLTLPSFRAWSANRLCSRPLPVQKKDKKNPVPEDTGWGKSLHSVIRPSDVLTIAPTVFMSIGHTLKTFTA